MDLPSPTGLAIHPSQRLLYVKSGADGTVWSVPIDEAGICGAPTPLTTGFSVHEPIVFDGQGSLYGTVFNDDELVRLTPAGTIEKWGAAGRSGIMSAAVTIEPPGLPTSRLYYISTGQGLYSLPIEAFLTTLGPTNLGGTCGSDDFRYLFYRPLDPTQPSFREMIGTYGDTVVAIDPLTSDCTATLLSGLVEPHGVAEDANRILYVADARAGQVLKIVAVEQSQVVASGLNFPTGIVFDPQSGLLFVSETTANQVVALNPAPSTCPTGVALVGVPDRQMYITALHDLRDRILNQTTRGQEYTRLFYQHSAEVAYLMVRYADLRRSARDVLTRIQPAIQALLANDPATLTGDDVSAIDRLITALSSKGSSALQADLQTFQLQLQQETALAEIGLMITD